MADDSPGHSKHGSAFDSGMRTRPWEMPGIGYSPFPITSKNPEVQKWFDQGNALLHSFWWEEAERSFRWCIKLDPDCAMAYWSLARCGFNWFTMSSPNFTDSNFKRYHAFLKEAVKRKHNVPERERMYIEAWEMAVAPDQKEGLKTLNRHLQNIIIKYPADLEAKALLSMYNIGQGSAFANELIVQDVLAKNPMHPGAHHASIHNWDGVAAAQSIRSCESYSKAAPGIGHALHMPGHIYSKIGMWHEAAIAMDSATRTELRYMNERLALPFETWNYPHNRNYLCYIQEQLGMAEASIQGARDLLAAPQDPEYNPEGQGALAGQGQAALYRALVKFERWDELLVFAEENKAAKDIFSKLLGAFAETFALHGLGKHKEATESLTKLRAAHKAVSFMFKADPNYDEAFAPFPIQVPEALVALGEGRVLEGQMMLRNAAENESRAREQNKYPSDPPMDPWPVARLLADDYLSRGEHDLAIKFYDRALAHEPNDGFALSGLARAHHAKGSLDQAKYYAGRLEYVWSQADPNLKWLTSVRKLGRQMTPVAVTPEKERQYIPKKLDPLGPMNWRPFAAPSLKVRDINGKSVQLTDYRGKNVLLVFFLGDACVHCVGQLKSINDRMADFEAQNTTILAVCSATPESLKDSATLATVKMNFLSDTKHENARRFSSYDDFEEIELHSTIIIDKHGDIRWKRTGGDPFMNMNFLLAELKRVNAKK